MKIVRHNSDVLLLESLPALRRKTPVVVTVALLTLAVAAYAAWRCANADWWPRTGIGGGLAMVSALEVGIGLLGYMVCETLLTECGMAFDRHTREILFVRKSLFRDTREVIGFDSISRVVVEKIITPHGANLLASLQRTDGRKIPVAEPRLFECSFRHVLEVATAMRATLGFPEPEPVAQSSEDSWPARTMGIVMGAFLLGLGIFLAHHATELWQTRSWPQIEGVVESVELGQKMKTGKQAHLADAVEIVYRYQLGDTIYFGRRFKTSSNWLTPEEVLLVRQKYRPDDKCLVTYKPTDPACCFLRLDVGLPRVIGNGLGALASGLIGLVLVVSILRKIARPKPTQAEPEADVEADVAGITVPA